MKYINKERLEKIILTKENFCVLIDFDRTITTYRSPDSWDIAGKAANKGCDRELSDLYEKYRPIEVDYNIEYKEKYRKMEEWYNACMNTYYKYNFNKYKLQKAVKASKLEFRKGAKEFLESNFKNNIPVIIISAGVGNVIKEFLKQNNCFFNNMLLISNTFTFDERGNAKSLENSLIHTMNKTIEGKVKEKWKEEFLNRKYRLLLGDTIEDIDMTDNKENTIKVGFLDKNLENIDAYKKEFDILLTENDSNFTEINNIIKII